MAQKPELDTTAKRFLGSQLDEVRVIAGQKADEKKQLAAQEKYLLAEACQFGDSLVHYVMGHRKINELQRVWGFALSVFCLRADYPEGVEDFDTLVDRGGEDLRLAATNTVQDSERAKQILRELPVFTDEEQRAAATFAERMTKYIESTKNRKGLSNPQAAYGLGRTFHNLRLGFPANQGGTVAFDEFVRRSSAYYERFKPR